MRVRDPLDRVDVAEVAVHVHRHDRRGARGDEALDALRVDRVVVGPDIGEHRHEAHARDRVDGGGERERRGDDLGALGQAHGLERALEREVAVAEQRNVVHPEIILETKLQLPVLRPHVGEPVRVPERRELLHVLRHRRHRRARDENPVGHGDPSYPVFKVRAGAGAPADGCVGPARCGTRRGRARCAAGRRGYYCH